MLIALLTAFALGFIYFVSAIPTAVLAGAPLWIATIMASLGYCMGSLSVLILGAPLRSLVTTKLKISLEPNEKKLFWRIWSRYGVIGLGLIAPITIGPQVSTLFLLALGERPRRILAWVSLGSIPWALGFALVVKFGIHAFSYTSATL